MLKKEDWMYIKAQVERGVYQKDIARELGGHLEANGPKQGEVNSILSSPWLTSSLGNTSGTAW
jgi:hypothetical protein